MQLTSSDEVLNFGNELALALATFVVELKNVLSMTKTKPDILAYVSYLTSCSSRFLFTRSCLALMSEVKAKNRVGNNVKFMKYMNKVKHVHLLTLDLSFVLVLDLAPV